MKELVKQHPILSFLVLNYAISWAFLYPSYQMILKNDGITPLSFIGLIGAYGPTVAAIVVQAIIDKKGVGSLLAKLLKVKCGVPLYLFVLLFPIGLYMLSYLIGAAANGGDLTFDPLKGISSIPIWFLLALPFGPMGEELGWRGFMLPKLMEKFSIIKSTVLVGLAWGIWHAASFTFPGAAIPDFLPVNIWTILLYCANTIGLGMVFTYVHLKSGGSVFMAILLHAFFNAAGNITADFFGETDDYLLQLWPYVINMVFAGIIGWVLIGKAKKGDGRKN